MRTEQEIRENLRDVYDTEPDVFQDNDYMQGYAKALEWVLEPSSSHKNDIKQQK